MVVWGHPDYGGNDSRIKWMLTEGVVSPLGFHQDFCLRESTTFKRWCLQVAVAVKNMSDLPGLVPSLMQTECSPRMPYDLFKYCK